MTDLTSLLSRQEFPRSNRYEPEWVLDNQMGPNALWLVEYLAEALPLGPGMRVLDLGCGRALTSIFLAREFGVKVWATDLWITPDHNRRRAEEAGVGGAVYPLRAEAHALPFPTDFFDAVVSIDAYQYFGTDVLYLAYLARVLRPGGHVGIVVPGLMQPITEVPAHLVQPQANGRVFWEESCWSLRTADFWREHWSRSGCVTGVRVDTLEDGWRYWRDFEKIVEAFGKSIFPSDAEVLERDGGRYLGFVRAVATRTSLVGMNLYDPAIGIESGVDK